jgi:hypothetical protein
MKIEKLDQLHIRCASRRQYVINPFVYLIQAFINIYKPLPKQPEFRFFPENKNGNLQTQNGVLLNQPTNSKGQPFNFDKTFYINDIFF